MELTATSRKVRVNAYKGIYPLYIEAINKVESQALVTLRENSTPIHPDQLNKIITLHERLGHISPTKLVNLINNKAIDGIDSVNITELNKIVNLECETCSLGKGHRTRFSNKSNYQIKASRKLFRLHADITGPIKLENQNIINGLGNYKYYSIIVDEYTGFISGRPIINKSDTDSHLKDTILYLETLTQQSVVFIRCDGGGEYKSTELLNLFKSKGIRKQWIPSKDQIADIFTKSLNRIKLKYLIDKIMGEC
jgi:hypothetical protein